MLWIDQKIADINSAIEEIEQTNLSDQTKKTILNILKEELRSLDLEKQKIESDRDFVKNGFGK